MTRKTFRFVYLNLWIHILCLILAILENRVSLFIYTITLRMLRNDYILIIEMLEDTVKIPVYDEVSVNPYGDIIVFQETVRLDFHYPLLLDLVQ